MNDNTALEAVQPLYATAISFIVINAIFICLRFYTVLFLRPKRLGLYWDDWLLIPAYVFCTALSIIGLVIHHYEGRDNPSYTANEEIRDPDRLELILQSVFAILLVLSAGYAFTRFSILAFYLRIFTVRWMRVLSYFFITFITLQWLAYSIATIVQCKPVSYYWSRHTPGGGHCFDIDRFNRSFTPVNISADTIILLMPLPVIWNFEASKLRKIGYSAILGMGTFALAASVVRAVILDSNSTVIITPAVSNLEIEWLIIEPSLYFITSCLPAMHPLFRLVAPEPLRRATEIKIAQARHNRTGNLGTRHGSNDAVQPFARLADDDPSLQRERHRAGSKSVGPLGAAGGVPDSEVEATAVGKSAKSRDSEIRQGAAAVPMQDLRQVERGDRIIVHTEIIVSQEERIENIMGF